jgi:hypothetical protein
MASPPGCGRTNVAGVGEDAVYKVLLPAGQLCKTASRKWPPILSALESCWLFGCCLLALQAAMAHAARTSTIPPDDRLLL